MKEHNLTIPSFVDKGFDAESLVARLIADEFDEDLTEEVRRLSASQLEEVVSLLERSPETDTEDFLLRNRERCNHSLITTVLR